MASTSLAYLFLNVYSKPATGSPELFSSVGINGFQTFIVTSIFSSSSLILNLAKGNFTSKSQSLNRGNPHVPPYPFVDCGWPTFFQSGTCPSTTILPLSTPFKYNPANIVGSFNISVLCLIFILEIAPLPSTQNIPVPNPPIGKAILLVYSPVYFSL